VVNTSVQGKVEQWLRSSWSPWEFGQAFEEKTVRLTSGGQYKCDAVSQDEKMLVAICTSGKTTASGNQAAGSIKNVRSDRQLLSVAEGDKK
jgi:hypothetical protein